MELEPLRPGEVAKSTDMVSMARLCLYINEHKEACIFRKYTGRRDYNDSWTQLGNEGYVVLNAPWSYRINPEPIERWVMVAENGVQKTFHCRKAAEREADFFWGGRARIVHLVEAPTDSEEGGE
jgi:hypothetical protein